MEINGTFSLPVHHRSNLQVWLTSALNTEHVVALIEKRIGGFVGKLQEGRSNYSEEIVQDCGYKRLNARQRLWL
ncbi:hypothetical protein L2E82_02955 [Cichorium intybus]|uniref:Uncharacterized protein n=1 Tax=Cichorium intybus TaxID=13427 RepID=A0ACB9H327_CICIN|nr:hypothetical protein L2E82_02955 [Cichorium intybus]